MPGRTTLAEACNPGAARLRGWPDKAPRAPAARSATQHRAGQPTPVRPDQARSSSTSRHTAGVAHCAARERPDQAQGRLGREETEPGRALPARDRLVERCATWQTFSGTQQRAHLGRSGLIRRRALQQRAEARKRGLVCTCATSAGSVASSQRPVRRGGSLFWHVI